MTELMLNKYPTFGSGVFMDKKIKLLNIKVTKFEIFALELNLK